jgi:hypothetical protein
MIFFTEIGIPRGLMLELKSNICGSEFFKEFPPP